jgi:tetratricopeptide (TPR) repeat protein
MLAKALYGCGKWNDALFVAEMDLETFRGGLGEVHPWTAMLYHLIGAINSGLGRYDRVLQAHSRACRIWAACGKTDTSEYVFTALQTAECLIALKEFDRARACIGAANDVRTRLDSNHLCTLQALITECNLLHRTDRTQDAIAMATKANIFAVKELWDDHQAILMSELDKCDILLAAGRTEAAEPVLSREYAQIDKYGEGPCDLPRFHLVEMYARLLLAKGEFIESERLLRGAIEIVERKQSPRHPMLRHVLEPYAIVLDKLGRHEEAKRMEARREAIATSLRKAGHRIKADPECTFPWEE